MILQYFEQFTQHGINFNLSYTQYKNQHHLIQTQTQRTQETNQQNQNIHLLTLY